MMRPTTVKQYLLQKQDEAVRIALDATAQATAEEFRNKHASASCIVKVDHLHAGTCGTRCPLTGVFSPLLNNFTSPL